MPLENVIRLCKREKYRYIAYRHQALELELRAMGGKDLVVVSQHRAQARVDCRYSPRLAMIH